MIDNHADGVSNTSSPDPQLGYEVRHFQRADGLRSSSLLGPNGIVQPVNEMIQASFLGRQVSPNTLRAWCDA